MLNHKDLEYLKRVNNLRKRLGFKLDQDVSHYNILNSISGNSDKVDFSSNLN